MSIKNKNIKSACFNIFSRRNFVVVILLSFMAPSAKSDLLDGPAEENTPATKENSKPGQSGLIREDGMSKPVKTPPPKPQKDRDREERAEKERASDTKKPPKGDKSQQSNNVPIKYRSERLSGQKEGGVLVLEEDVVVTQGEMRIEADKATIHFDQATNEVIDCVAVGNVKFYQKDPETGSPVTAEGKEAVFNNRQRTVILKGDPKLVRGGDVVRGRQILYDLTTGWVKAERVEGVVQPAKQDAGKTGKASPSKPDAGKKETPEVRDPKESTKP